MQAGAVLKLAADAMREAYILAFSDAFYVLGGLLSLSLPLFPSVPRPQRPCPPAAHMNRGGAVYS